MEDYSFCSHIIVVTFIQIKVQIPTFNSHFSQLQTDLLQLKNSLATLFSSENKLSCDSTCNWKKKISVATRLATQNT
jgi:hypothetical protein